MEERRRRRVYCVCSSFSPLFFFNCNPLHTFSPPSPLYVCADLLIAWCVLCACIVTPATPPVTPAMDNGIPIFGGEASLFALPGEKNVFREGTDSECAGPDVDIDGGEVGGGLEVGGG